MYENDPRSRKGRGGSRKEGTDGTDMGPAAGIITADLRVMGAPTRREPARSLAEHGRGGRPRGYVPVFDNGLTDEWRGRCDLHACHLDRLSLARSSRSFKCQCQGATVRLTVGLSQHESSPDSSQIF